MEIRKLRIWMKEIEKNMEGQMDKMSYRVDVICHKKDIW